MNTNHKIAMLFILLAGSMYFWVSRDNTATGRLVSMFMLVIVSYFLGREHSKKILQGEKLNREN